MKTIKHIFTETGEMRVPDMDELYWSNIDLPCTSSGGIETPKRIVIYERIEEEWKPKENSLYFSINNFLKIYEYAWKNSIVDNDLYESGNCFPTKELAEEKLKQIKDILKGVTQ